MTKQKKPWGTAGQIAAQLDPSYFKEYPIAPVLGQLEKGDFDKATEAAAVCLWELWKNYSQENIASVLNTFPKVQKALFGLELDEDKGGRYRDHFVHMFNVFVFGAVVLSSVVRGLPDESRDEYLAKWLKITAEEEDKVPFFVAPYPAEKRLYFLWTLMSTFHDVGIPIEHLNAIPEALNAFLKHFGLQLPDMGVESEVAVAAKLDYYLRLMSKLSDGGVELDVSGDRTYVRPADPHPYIYSALAREFSRHSHGVVSAICLFRSIEETFGVGVHPEEAYRLKTLDEYALYNRNVLEEDVTRAALAIAMHCLPPDDYPNLFPLSTDGYPLACLLILCDELQEFYRQEGISLAGTMRMKCLPRIAVEVDNDSERVAMRFEYTYINPDEAEGQAIVEQASAYARDKGLLEPNDFKDVVRLMWDGICDRIREKILFEPPFHLELVVNWTTKNETQNIATLKLP